MRTLSHLLPFPVSVRLRASTFTLLALVANASGATALSVQVTDTTGQAMADAVVYAEPAGGQALPKNTKNIEIEQKGRRFLPLVTAVQAGSSVSFPNNDTVRHHVYSFSPAKTFDIKLYAGESNPIVFDKPGTVVVGCNIHDRMVAYIHVVPTPYFIKTDTSGKAHLDVPVPGKYTLKAWHYGMPAGAAPVEQVINVGGTELAATFKLNAKTGPATN